MWHFWRRKKSEPEFELHSETLPLSTLFRWYCYDLQVENPNRFSDAYGLTPISSEGEEMEKRDSYLRMLRVVPFFPYLETIAEINAMVLSENQNQALLKMFKENGLPEKDIDEIMPNVMDIYKGITMSGLISAFSSAIQLGLVHPQIGSFITKETEIDDEF